MAKLYEPTARFYHASCAVKSGAIVRGGRTLDYESGSRDARIKLANEIELFDPYLEVWRQLNTTGTPHPGLRLAACASLAEDVYMYGGHSGERIEGVFSYFNMKKLTWSQLCPEDTAGAPMRKFGCRLIIVHDDIIVIGGYGIPTGPPQLGAIFIKNTKSTDGSGWTNELHSFNVVQGLWSSPTVRGTRLRPCADFTLTQINTHRAVSFGGSQPGLGRKTNDLYIFDFNAMEVSCTKIERHEGEPWPVGRSFHAACCIGCSGDHVNLLISGGLDSDGKALKDMWLFDIASNKWKEVTLPNGCTLARWGHSVTAITLCHGLVDVNLFGGTTDDFIYGRPDKDCLRISETTILTFEQHGSEWVMVDVVKNSQRGSSERIREKMVNMKERAAALAGERQQVEEALAISQANERSLEERVREDRERAEKRVKEAQEQAREAQKQAHEAQQRAVAREMAAEVEVQEAEQRAVAMEMAAEVRVQEAEQQAVAREMAAEVRVQEAEQRAVAKETAAEINLQQAQEQADQEEQRAIALVKKNAELERRLHEMEERVRGSKRRTNVIELQDDSTSDSDKLSSVDLHTVLNLTWDARSKWYNIGLNVGIPVGTLDAVRRNHRDICEDCYRTVLGDWLRDHPSPTWSALEDALRAPSVKMSHIAEQLPFSKTCESETEDLGSHDQSNLIPKQRSQSSNTTGRRRPCCVLL